MATTDQARLIIVHYGDAKPLNDWIQRSRDRLGNCSEIVIVDNGGEGQPVGDLSATGLPITHIKPGSNTGFAAGNNIGATGCTAKWIVTLNPDAYPEPGWLEELIAASKRHPEVAMFGSVQIQDEDRSKWDGVGDCYFPTGMAWRGGYGHRCTELSSDAEVFSPCAAAAMYDRGLFEELGGFDERFFCYMEDIDLAFRMRLTGNKCIQVASAKVFHIGGASAGSDSDFARYHGARNLVWTFVKNMPGPLFWPLLPLHVAMILVHMTWALGRGHPSPVVGGYVAAIRKLPTIWQSRRRIQARRRARTWVIGKAMTWSPLTMLRRTPDLRIPNRTN